MYIKNEKHKLISNITYKLMLNGIGHALIWNHTSITNKYVNTKTWQVEQKASEKYSTNTVFIRGEWNDG